MGFFQFLFFLEFCAFWWRGLGRKGVRVLGDEFKDKGLFLFPLQHNILTKRSQFM